MEEKEVLEATTTYIWRPKKYHSTVKSEGQCLRNEKQIYSTRQQGRESLMVWIAVGGKTSMVFIHGRQNHDDYIRQLESDLLLHRPDGGDNWIFQQDGAPFIRPVVS